MENIFETVSFHIMKPCNMKCKFCYATFQDFKVQKQLSLDECIIILDKLKDAGVKKVTFAGGEPMLHKQLALMIIYAKSIGLTTSIITNGSLLTQTWLESMVNYLDWIGLSIDSLNQETNLSIGRITNGNKHHLHYTMLISSINNLGYKLKVNTVVNRYNQHEDLSDFITRSNVQRWKVFDTLRIEGQNDEQFDEIKSTDFKGFIKRNQHKSMVVESNDLMTGSYLLIDPLGRMFENSSGTYTYSDSLINKSIEHCLSQINLNRDKFLERGGIYKW